MGEVCNYMKNVFDMFIEFYMTGYTVVPKLSICLQVKKPQVKTAFDKSVEIQLFLLFLVPFSPLRGVRFRGPVQLENTNRFRVSNMNNF